MAEPIRRSAPLKRSHLRARGGSPKRSTKRIRSRKKDPTKRRFAKRRCQPYLDWLKEQPCCVTGKLTGEWPFIWSMDKERGWVPYVVHAAPMAHHLHEESHHIGIKTFAKRYGVDLPAIARDHTKRFLAEFPEYSEAVA